MADVLWQMTTPSSADAAPSRVYATSRALFVFRRARDIIEHHLADGISITTLCRSTGVSRRSLELVFRAEVGMGPSGYIRTLRLNEVRRDLLATVDEDESIGKNPNFRVPRILHAAQRCSSEHRDTRSRAMKDHGRPR